jgi:hypothetical protein
MSPEVYVDAGTTANRKRVAAGRGSFPSSCRTEPTTRGICSATRAYVRPPTDAACGPSPDRTACSPRRFGEYGACVLQRPPRSCQSDSVGCANFGDLWLRANSCVSRTRPSLSDRPNRPQRPTAAKTECFPCFPNPSAGTVTIWRWITVPATVPSDLAARPRFGHAGTKGTVGTVRRKGMEALGI